jgi:hypothetical protein
VKIGATAHGFHDGDEFFARIAQHIVNTRRDGIGDQPSDHFVAFQFTKLSCQHLLTHPPAEGHESPRSDGNQMTNARQLTPSIFQPRRSMWLGPGIQSGFSLFHPRLTRLCVLPGPPALSYLQRITFLRNRANTAVDPKPSVNLGLLNVAVAQGSISILVTFSFLSRHTLYMSGAWPRLKVRIQLDPFIIGRPGDSRVGASFHYVAIHRKCFLKFLDSSRVEFGNCGSGFLIRTFSLGDG